MIKKRNKQREMTRKESINVECKIKYNKQTTRSQDHIPKYNPPTKEQTKNNIQLYMQYAQDTDVRLFNLFVDLCNKFKTVYVSHKQLAEWSGFSIGTVRNSIRRLKEAGLLFTQYRGIKQTLYYKVAHHLFTPEVRYALSHLVPALQFVALTLLFTQKNCQSESLTLINYSFFKNTNSTLQKYSKCIVTGTKKIVNGAKKENVVEVYGQKRPQNEDLIPSYVKNLESIELTKAGQVWLCAFPESVIKQADKALLKADNIGSPFGYLMKACIKIAEKQGIKPNWTARFNLASELHVSDNDEMIESYDFKSNQAKIKQSSKTFVKKERNENYERIELKPGQSLYDLSPDERNRYLKQRSDEINLREQRLQEMRRSKSATEQIDHLQSEEAQQLLQRIGSMALWANELRKTLIEKKESEIQSGLLEEIDQLEFL